jgi:HSP20 family protein
VKRDVLLTTFDPFVHEFDRLAQQVFGTVDGGAHRGAVLPMDVIRGEGEVVLRFDLPGIDPGSADVTVERNVLTISAQRTEEPGEGAKVLVRERPAGTFRRRVSLADTVDSDRIEATYTDGVLTVRLPLSERARPRRVEIQVGDQKKITA